MKTSLRQQLNSYIQSKGVVSYQEIKDLVESGYFGKKYRASNMERRLRQSESPMVQSVYKDGHVQEYRWLGAPKVEPRYQMMRVEGTDIFVKVLVK